LSYESAAVRVKFCLTDNPRATIEDYFVLPPDDPSQLRAYWEGTPPGKKSVGFNANKFYQFIGAIGFPYPAGGELPAEAARLGNWKGRTVMVTVKAGEPYTDKAGLEKMGRNQVKLFSYRASEATVNGSGASVTGARTHPQDPSQPTHRPAPAPATQPRRAAVPAGVDDLDL
jgi:hypothetical protein